MALLFCDSFDHYSAATSSGKWLTYGGTPSIVSGGRSGNCLEIFDIDYLYYASPVASSTYTIGFAFYTNSHGSGNSRILSLIDNVSHQCDIRHDGSGHLQVTRAGTFLAAGTTIIPLSTWVYVEFQVVIHDSTGTIEVRLDGTTEITFGPGDTRNAGTTADRFYIGSALGGGDNSNFRIDDLVVLNDTGSAPNNDFIGDVRVEAIFPSGNGNSSQFIGSDANSTDNYLLVDETVPDSDTTYVDSDVVGNKDTYAFGNVTPTAGTVFGTQLIPWARKTDAGARKIVTVARLSATETDSAEHTLSTSYQYLYDMRETKPGGGAWTISDVNSAEFGVKVST